MTTIVNFVRTYRVSFVLGLLVLVVVGPVVQPNNAQPASRFALTAALVEHHSVDLGPYKHELGIDFSTYRGHLRSDKAPGQPIYAIPAYAFARLVGADTASHRQIHKNLGLWFDAFWSSMLPLAVLIGLLYAECCRYASRGTALAVSLLFAFSTMLLPFGAVVFGHILAALCGFGAWLVVSRTPNSPRRALVAGLLAGTAVMMEYEAAIIVAVLALYVVIRNRPRIVQFAGGVAVPAVVLAWYQWRAFGAPWRTPAAFYNLKSGYTVPSPHDLWGIVGGHRGLWIGAPIAIIAIGGAIWLVVTARGAVRDYAIVALAIVVPYIVLCAGWSGTPELVDPGPRYLIPSLPFLAVPLAIVWRRVRVIAIPAAVFGAAIAFGALWVLAIVRKQYTNLLAVYRYFIAQRRLMPTLWTMAFGWFGIVLYAASIVAVVALLVHVCRERTDVRSSVPEPLR